MVKRLNKTIAVLLALVVMVVNAMTMTVSAAGPSGMATPMGSTGYWFLNYDYNKQETAHGRVSGMVDGVDTGVTFHVNYFKDKGKSEFYGYGQIENNLLRADNATGCKFDYAGKTTTDLFCSNWYALNDYSDKVKFYIMLVNYTPGLAQEISGTVC